MTQIPSMKSLGFCAVIGVFTFCCGSLPAATVSGLCNTGTTAITGGCSGVLTGTNTVDPSFTLTGGPSYVVVADSTGFPLNSWIPNSSASEWIGPVASQPSGGPCCASGDYTYSETFTLGDTSAPTPITGEWAADDEATMYINGVAVQTGGTASTFKSWTPFTFTADPGVNTLTFVVDNYNEATGLRVEFTGVAPEPTTFAALGTGLVIIGFIKRKRFGRPTQD